jgi:ketosteroid isomerase-like protein
MSRENVELVQRGYEMWNAGDMDRVREIYSPDVIMRAPPGWPEPGPFIGVDAVIAQFVGAREAWDEDAFEFVSGFLAAGDRVAIRTLWRASGHGPESKIEWTNVFTVRNGQIVFLEYFWDHGDALDALGLSPAC